MHVDLIYVWGYIPFGMLLLDRAACNIRIELDGGMIYRARDLAEGNRGRIFIQICTYTEGIHVQGDMGKSSI